MIHTLKTWPQFFAPLLSGEKTFELRKNDRPFGVGDTLKLVEYDPTTEQFSGRAIDKRVTHIMDHDSDAGCAATFGLREGYVIMSLVNF